MNKFSYSFLFSLVFLFAFLVLSALTQLLYVVLAPLPCSWIHTCIPSPSFVCTSSECVYCTSSNPWPCIWLHSCSCIYVCTTSPPILALLPSVGLARSLHLFPYLRLYFRYVIRVAHLHHDGFTHYLDFALNNTVMYF